LAALTPEQKQYTVNLTCAKGEVGMTLPKTEPERIQFASGATSARLQGQLYPGGIASYVLGGAAGQTMSINLNPGESGVLSIWGLDGTTLTDASEMASGIGIVLPATQDYFIDVISIAENPFDYTLDVSISALPASSGGQVFPRVEPFATGAMQSIAGYGVPVMLPAVFIGQAGLPPITSYLVQGAPGEYEFSLDYGEECRGAGACHFGVIAGKQTSFATPTGTTYTPFDSSLAEMVSLSRGITGYFINYACGASCGDAQVWWVYNGYQYMVGMKAGDKSAVVGMANAAIENSVP
jgi:hypothetical protein